MLDIEDRAYQPSAAEIGAFVGNGLFDELCRCMADEYQALCKIEYSGDRVLPGWNMKFKKAGRALCTVYPRKGRFSLLLVVGQREKQRVEALLPGLSEAFRETYRNTPEGMGQRWLLFDFDARSALYDDVLRVIRIRRTS